MTKTRRQQSAVIDYLIEENRVLKEQLESVGRRLRFTDDQRRRLAAKGKPLGRKSLRQIATIVKNPTSAWMEQVARNLTDCDVGFLIGKRFLIIDRDALYAPRFKGIVESIGTEIILTAYQAPNMNACAERLVRSIQSECLDRMILVGKSSLDRAVAEYLIHYHDERSHQGIGNEIVSGVTPQSEGSIEVAERLGGLLSYYHRRAA